jgi:hypothetical protein
MEKSYASWLFKIIGLLDSGGWPYSYVWKISTPLLIGFILIVNIMWIITWSAKPVRTLL